MAGRDSAGPFMRGVTETGSAPQAARSSRSGQGEQWPSGAERDGLAGEQSGGSIVINPSPKTPRRPHISCTSTYILVVYYGRARHHGSLWRLLNPINTNPQIDDGVCRARNSSGIGFTLSRAASTPVGIGHDASRLVAVTPQARKLHSSWPYGVLYASR